MRPDNTPLPFQSGLVSVITPVYNGETYLSRLLTSLLFQSYPHLEIILSDDGSTDGTLRIAEGFRERFLAKGCGFRTVTGPHKNASAAINRGLPYVTGEFLIWPDGDDALEPDSVQKRVYFLRAHPEYQCVRSLPFYFDVETGTPGAKPDESIGDLDNEDLFWPLLEARTYVCCGCYMLRSRPFFEIYPDRRIPEYGIGQNFQMLLPFMYRYKCPTLREPLYVVTLRRGSHSRTPLTQAQETAKYAAYERLADEIAGLCHLDPEERKRVQRWKLRRRYALSLKYGRKRGSFLALYRLYACGDLSLTSLAKNTAWICFFNNPTGKKLYQAYKARHEKPQA